MFKYFLRSARVTFLLIVGLAALGVWTAVTLPRESAPEVEIPFAVVVTAYPGASARDVEELVTKTVEDELVNLEGLKTLTSSSKLGISQVSVEFEADEDIDEAIDRLKEAVDRVASLPTDVEDPVVVEVNFSDEPIVSISLGGIDDERLLTVLADELEKQIETISGVSGVSVAGVREEEVRVEVAPHRLADLGLSMGQLLGSIRANNLNAPFGQLETTGFNYDLRVVGRFQDVSDVADIAVPLTDGRVLPLSEVAKVTLGLTEMNSRSRISLAGEESKPAVTLSVRKKTGGNIIKIVDAVEKKVSEAERDWLPEGVVTLSLADRADEIRQSLSNVYRSGGQTLLIVFGLLWLFLGWRPALITSLAIPLTFSISFLVFDLTDTTLNGISLFSLILSLGLLVDTAIVMVEGICSHSEENDLEKHAGRIIDRFKKPLAGGTLTTVAAFFPMLLVTGIIGEFLKVIPVVVTATLLSSLFVALSFIPPVAVAALKGRPVGESGDRWFDRKFKRFSQRYSAFIGRLLENKRGQTLFIGLLMLALIVGLSLPFTGVLKTGLFPAVDIDFMLVNVELPPGTQLEETDKVMRQVEEQLRQVPEIESYAANVGSGVSLDIGGGGSGGEALGSFFINLNKDRERSSLDIADGLRGGFAQLTGARVEVTEISAGPPTAPPVELRLVGDDLDELDRESLKVMEKLEQIDGTIEIDRNLRNSAGEFNFVFDREALARFGLTAAEVAQNLRMNVFGLEATTYLDARGDEVRVTISGEEEAVDAIDDVMVLPLLTPRGEMVALGQVATVDLSSSVDAVRHRDGERAVSVTAKAAKGANPNSITQEIMKQIEEQGLPEGVRVEFGGEQQETTETFNQLYRSMIIAVILIMLILVVEFNSYRQPWIILLTIPLALIGVLFGLLITGGQLNFAAFIGLVSLTGIVVNNAILLVDRMNRLRKRGRTIKEAVKQATDSRLRPIILTTITTAAGVAPLIWVDEFFRDMALTLITGLMFSAILTLVLIPILYYRQQEKLERKRERKLAGVGLTN